ncbi:MAG: glycoside hydrolase family 1 protein [Candidatus Omnitrophica bacterium]|nr:glycoside hydrolase family 1 protein [Candidatus Omnitrophota bacterium]
MDKKTKALIFPEGFFWGAATSSYQVEGANTNNDWWLWEQQDGRIADGQRCALACNHYHLYNQDFDIAKELGHNMHRFSLEWSRIEPKRGEWNQEAVEHYRRVILALKERGMTPAVTLFHFCLPIWVSEMGGFENREIVSLFQRYVTKVCRELGEHINYWFTINEPMVFLYKGYFDKTWPPGKNIGFQFFRIIRHMVQAHNQAYFAIHKISEQFPDKNTYVGLTKNVRIFQPYRGGSILDKLAAKFKDYFFNDYMMAKIFKSSAKTIDFIGLNYYTREFASLDILNPKELFRESRSKRADVTDLGWEIYPFGIYQALVKLKKYGIPIVVAENGLADKEDKKRAKFILDHLVQIHQAIEDGADIIGYLHWSLLDNFEWADGYRARFGLVEVDYQSQQRTIRDSARSYAEICRTNQIII